MKCPDRAQLRAFLRFEASPDVRAHVESCPLCQETLQDFGTLEEDVRAAAQLPSLPGAAAPQPRRVGCYDLLHKLGAGGMGEVWLARHVTLGKLSAAKMLRADRGGYEALKRHHREGRLVAQMDHPNIVDILHAEEIDGRLVLFMKYVDGYSLFDLVQRHGPLAAADACELIRQAAEGLQFAHQRGVVHRDIKPGNLMIDRTLTVKVLDFGLARGGDEAADGQLTQPGDWMGTPEYMAPEQVSAASSVGIRADLYALGCTLYYLLTAEPPFTEQSEGGRLNIPHAHCHKAIPPLRQRRPDVAASLATLIETKLLAKSPEQRLATPALVSAALQPWARQHNLSQLLGVPPGGGGAPPPRSLPPGVLPPLDAALSLVFWNTAEARRMTLEEPGVLPVKAGDEFRIEVRLNRPGYVYLLWIDGAGQASPVHPWTPGSDWELAATEQVGVEVRLPAGGSGEVWPIQGPPGVETLVLLARDQALSADEHEDFPGWLPPRFPALTSLPDPRRPRWFTCRREELHGAEAAARGFNPQPRAAKDPLFQLDSVLRERFGSRFQLVHAVSFVNAGAKGEQS